MTAGLILPFTGGYALTQSFAGDHPYEPKGILTTDAIGPKTARLALAKSAHPGYRTHLHAACDWGMPVGTKLRAMQSGIVIAQGTITRFPDGSPDGEIFQMVQIRRDATSQTLLLMTHLSKVIVKVGHVTKGQVIALSGRSGRITGPHTHVQLVTGSRFASPAVLMWGTGGVRWNIMRCLEGKDLAGSKFLIPNV